jgi:hypothetical protein
LADALDQVDVAAVPASRQRFADSRVMIRLAPNSISSGVRP